MEEEDEVKEIEREESRPQAICILHKWGDEVVVVEEEDTIRAMVHPFHGYEANWG